MHREFLALKIRMHVVISPMHCLISPKLLRSCDVIQATSVQPVLVYLSLSAQSYSTTIAVIVFLD